MKNSTFITVLLTLLMLLLVAVAAFVFLFPRQETLRQENDAVMAESDQLRQELAQTGMELLAVQATRTVVTDALATAEADSIVLASELVVSDQKTIDLQTEQAELTAQLAEADAAMVELQIENAQMKGQFPFVTIIAPADEAVFSLDASIELVIIAYDPGGITAVNITLDDETKSHEGGDEPFFIYKQAWRPSEQGDHTIKVMGVNTEGKASTPVAVTIQLIDIEAMNASIRAEIEANVIELTGLEPLQPVEPVFLTRDELGDRFETELAEDLTPEIARRDTLVLSTFDFLEPEYDLYNALVDLYSEGILGFYDPENSEFVVVSDDNVLDVEEQFTHAHEFVHALQDQYYDLDLIDDDDLDSEASAALRALAEGHATLVQQLYLTEGYLSLDEINEIFAAYDEADTSVMDSAPAILTVDLEFPYTAGYDFAMSLYEKGGMEAIDDAWHNLPQSTEQILHFDRYEAGDLPQIVTLPPLTNTLGTDWHLLDEDTFGEFYLRQYLGQQLGENGVDAAASGWGGDRYAVYENKSDGSLAMVLRLAWDSVEDGAEFMAIFPQYAERLFAAGEGVQQDGLLCWSGTDDLICLTEIADSSVDDSLVIRAPDRETAVRIADEFLPFSSR